MLRAALKISHPEVYFVQAVNVLGALEFFSLRFEVSDFRVVKEAVSELARCDFPRLSDPMP
jgi:hypothetical protein